MNQTAAIYARVSSDRQKEKHTIASQTAALKEYAAGNGYSVPPEWVFEDEGYSGANMLGSLGLSEIQEATQSPDASMAVAASGYRPPAQLACSLGAPA
ncbi:MAG TPA: recombinase family protein [Pyrinomonadaceae bacterium]|nr:recombinase family protein [Pyrinomonadaceae bacterium]